MLIKSAQHSLGGMEEGGAVLAPLFFSVLLSELSVSEQRFPRNWEFLQFEGGAIFPVDK